MYFFQKNTKKIFWEEEASIKNVLRAKSFFGENCFYFRWQYSAKKRSNMDVNDIKMLVKYKKI